MNSLPVLQNKRAWLLPALLLLLVSLSCCSQNNKNAGSAESDTEYASRLRIRPGNGCTLVDILEPHDTTRILQRLVLVPRDSALPSPMPDGIVLRTPLQKVAIYSSVHEMGLKLLGAEGSIAAVTDAPFFTSEYISKGIASGRIADLGAASTPSAEKLLEVSPDAIILNVYDGMDVRGIERLGIPIIRLTDSFETSPLARAEWIRLYGALYGRQQKADSIFTKVAESYEKLRRSAAQRGQRPKVMTDNIYQGVWYVPGGASSQARLLCDAGADYIFASDSTTGSLPLSYEKVLERGADADIWVLKGFDAKMSKSSLLAEDSRYKAFKPFKTGNVYHCNTRDIPLFDITVFRPDIVLGQYVALFHPGLIEGLNCTYFQRIDK